MLGSPAKHRLPAPAAARRPYVPLLFMGEEYGEPSPFQYFVSHSDRDLVRGRARGGARNSSRSAGADDVPDPQAAADLDGSRLHFELGGAGEHATLREIYRELLKFGARSPRPTSRRGAHHRSQQRAGALDRDATRRAPGARLALRALQPRRGRATAFRSRPNNGDGWRPLLRHPDSLNAGVWRRLADQWLHCHPSPLCSTTKRSSECAFGRVNPVSAWRHLGWRGSQLRDLLRERDGRAALPLRRARRRRGARTDEVASAATDLALLPSRRAPRAALRLPRRRTCSPEEGHRFNPNQLPSILREGDQRRRFSGAIRCSRTGGEHREDLEE